MVWRVYFFSVLLLVAVGLAIFVVGAIFDGERGRRQLPRRLITHVAGDLAPLVDRPQALDEAIRRFGESFEVTLSIRRLDGELIASNEADPGAALDPESLRRLRADGVIRLEGKPPRLAVLLPVDGAPAAYLFAEFPRIEVPLGRPLAAIGAVLVVLALASLPFARSLVAPLERLTATAEELGRGKLSARSGLRRDDEVGTLAAALDEMASKLEETIHAQKELLANVSHEIRTPLARIRVALELAEEGDLQEARRYLADIGDDLGELDRLLEDVLTAARMDLGVGGAPPLRPIPTDMEELVERSVTRFRRQHPDRTLEVRVAPPLPRLDADPILLRRVLDNLLDNARKYSDGPITLSAEPREGGLAVAIEDRGIGIEAEDLGRISLPFFRTTRSRRHRAGGIGLGLSLAKSIAEAHGGRLEIESAPGKGSIFRIVLPAHFERAAESA